MTIAADILGADRTQKEKIQIAHLRAVDQHWVGSELWTAELRDGSSLLVLLDEDFNPLEIVEV